MRREPPVSDPSATTTEPLATAADRKSTRLNSSHTEIYTLSLHDALPILARLPGGHATTMRWNAQRTASIGPKCHDHGTAGDRSRSEEHTSELQSHRDLHSFPTRRSSDLSSASRRSRHNNALECAENRQYRTQVPRPRNRWRPQ